jgi:hypothetical protein
VRQIAVALAFVFSMGSAIGSAQQRFDGNGWTALEFDAVKTVYVAGLVDGASFLSIAMMRTSLGSIAAEDEYEAISRKFLSGVTTKQIVDGIDTFYRDFRNRRIECRDAAMVVLSQIAGTTESEIDAMIEHLRRLSVPK